MVSGTEPDFQRARMSTCRRRLADYIHTEKWAFARSRSHSRHPPVTRDHPHVSRRASPDSHVPSRVSTGSTVSSGRSIAARGSPPRTPCHSNGGRVVRIVPIGGWGPSPADRNGYDGRGGTGGRAEGRLAGFWPAVVVVGGWLARARVGVRVGVGGKCIVVQSTVRYTTQWYKYSNVVAVGSPGNVHRRHSSLARAFGVCVWRLACVCVCVCARARARERERERPGVPGVGGKNGGKNGGKMEKRERKRGGTGLALALVVLVTLVCTFVHGAVRCVRNCVHLEASRRGGQAFPIGAHGRLPSVGQERASTEPTEPLRFTSSS